MLLDEAPRPRGHGHLPGTLDANLAKDHTKPFVSKQKAFTVQEKKPGKELWSVRLLVWWILYLSIFGLRPDFELRS